MVRYTVVNQKKEDRKGIPELEPYVTLRKVEICLVSIYTAKNTRVL